MSDLLVVLPFFNYFGNKFIDRNLELVMENLDRQKIPFLVVESLLGDQTPRSTGIHLRGSDVIWQKERIVNHVFSNHEPSYPYVAWMDADILFPDGWADRALERLQEYPLVQLFRKLRYAHEDNTTDYLASGFAFRFASENFVPQLNQRLAGSPGGAWVARASLLREVGIYDRHITGGNDTMMSLTLAQIRGYYVRWMAKNPGQYSLFINREFLRHYTAWDQKFAAALVRESSSIDSKNWSSYIDVDATHLYHGCHQKRHYNGRSGILNETNFDPSRDVAISQGVLEWNSNKPELHRRIREMMEQTSRTESVSRNN